MRLLSSVFRFARWRLGIPPPDARVDPALFPEADYLVFCMRCGYDLRGLQNEQCPECGERFERGRLLVEQYARCKRPRSDGRYRLALWLRRVGFVLVIGVVFARLSILVAVKLWNGSIAELVANAYDLLLTDLLASIGIEVFGFVCVAISTILWLTTLPPRAKRQAVRKALRAAQRNPSCCSSSCTKNPD